VEEASLAAIVQQLVQELGLVKSEIRDAVNELREIRRLLGENNQN